MAKTKYATREEWLNAVALDMAPWFDDLGYPLPPVRMAIGFPSNGKRSKVIAETWDKAASNDDVFEILVRPDQDEPLEVISHVAHELIHAAVGVSRGHSGPFRQVALALGFTYPMPETPMTDLFKERVAPIIKHAGPLPHAKLDFNGTTTGPRKQTTRLVKCDCRECGYIAYTTHKWIDGVGTPACPNHGAMRISKK